MKPELEGAGERKRSGVLKGPGRVEREGGICICALAHFRWITSILSKRKKRARGEGREGGGWGAAREKNSRPSVGRIKAAV